MNPKNIGIGIFVRKDINGKDVMVGDTVRLIEPKKIRVGYEGETVVVGEEVWEGVVMIILSKGVVIKTKEGHYVKPPITDNSRNKWTWELLNKPK